MSKKNSGEVHKVEVFRPGTFRAMGGGEFSFSAGDLSDIAEGYDPETAPAPAVVGHPAHDDPAFGWARGFEVNEDGVLVAELERLEPSFVDAVREGRYRKISMKFFPPDHSANPKPGIYYPRHVGFLGGAAPAVSGLAPVEFADDGAADLIEVEFSLGDVAESTASIMRRVREFFIEQFSLEAADQAVPEYHIRWIEEAAQPKPEPADAPGFTATPNPQPETPMAKPEDLAARAAELDERQRKLDRAENVAFADDLIAEGKLTPAQKEPLVALMSGIASHGDEIAFSADGDEHKASALDLLKQVMTAQPEIVPQGQTDLGDAPGDVSEASFAAPDGLAVDQGDLALHGKALAYQADHPSVSYIDAVSAVQSAAS